MSIPFYSRPFSGCLCPRVCVCVCIGARFCACWLFSHAFALHLKVCTTFSRWLAASPGSQAYELPSGAVIKRGWRGDGRLGVLAGAEPSRGLLAFEALLSFICLSSCNLCFMLAHCCLSFRSLLRFRTVASRRIPVKTYIFVSGSRLKMTFSPPDHLQMRSQIEFTEC